MKKILSILLTALFLISCSVCTFAAVSVEDLLRQVPEGAYAGTDVTVENLKYVSLFRNANDILFDELLDSGKLEKVEHENPLPEDNPDAQRIAKSEVIAACEKLFGKGSFEILFGGRTEISDGSSKTLFYQEETDEYVYINSPYGGGDAACYIYKNVLKTEETENGIRIYVAYALYSQEYNANFWVNGNINRYNGGENVIVLNDNKSNSAEIIKGFKNGTIEKYLPVYVHTFIENEDGSYYWASTSLASEGGAIPADFNPATSDSSFVTALLLCAVSALGIAFTVKQYKKS